MKISIKLYIFGLFFITHINKLFCALSFLAYIGQLFSGLPTTRPVQNHIHRINDPFPQRSYIDATKERIDYTCLFRAYSYSEMYLNSLKVQSTHFNIEEFKKTVLKNFPQNLANREFLGLKLGNYLDAKIFQNLCKNAYQSSITDYPLMHKNIDYSIYNKIVFMQFDYLNGNLVGVTANKKYFNKQHEKSLKIYNKLKAHYQLSKHDSYFLINSQAEKLLEQIEYLHKNDSYAFSVVAVKSRHARTITIIKKNKDIHYVISDGLNYPSDNTIDTIKRFVEAPQHLKVLLEEYKQIT